MEMQLSFLAADGADTGKKAKIQWLELSEIEPHPDNPRLFVRQEVVETIASSIKETGFDPCYAVLVRPQGSKYQMISGHHRLEASNRAGITHIAAWVREMDDDEAFMALVLSNNQGELTPLEYGVHVLKYVEMSKGGRGQKGGLREYARQVGKPQPNLSSYKDAAKLIQRCISLDVSQLHDKASHLAAIHGAPERYWAALAEWMVKADWSVKTTEKVVEAIKDLTCSPEVLGKVLAGHHKQGQGDDAAKFEFNFSDFAQLATAAQQVGTLNRQEMILLRKTSLSELRKVDDLTARIKAQLEKGDYPDLTALWVAYIDLDPVDIASVQSERVQLENIAAARKRGTRQFQEIQADHPDLLEAWLEFLKSNPLDIPEIEAKRIEIEAIALERAEQARADEADKKPPEPKPLPNLVLADPPWRYDFSATDNRQIENHYPSADVDEIAQNMMPETQPDCVLFLWATVAKLPQAFEVIAAWGFEYKTCAVWDKEKIGMGYWFRGQHELLLVATKGSAGPPEPENRVSSVFREARGKHSKKPECVYQWIETAFPDAHKLEMFCRSPRDGWESWGNEATEQENQTSELL